MRNSLQCPPPFLLFLLPWAVRSAQVPARHVLFLGVDGTRPDAIRKAVSELEAKGDLPYFCELFSDGVYDFKLFSGGTPGTVTEQPTVSGPSWTTIFTGVWTNQHNIRSNEDLMEGKLNKSIPTLFNYINNKYPLAYTAALFDFDALENLIRSENGGQGPNDVFLRPSNNLEEAFQHAADIGGYANHFLKFRDPQLLFTYFVGIDETGHVDGGFSPENRNYINAIKEIGVQINSILEKIARKRRNGKKWLVVLVTDHGGIGDGHGKHSPEERDAFIILHDPSDPTLHGNRPLAPGRGLDAVTPTILQYLLADEYDPSQYPLLSSPLRLKDESQYSPRPAPLEPERREAISSKETLPKNSDSGTHTLPPSGSTSGSQRLPLTPILFPFLIAPAHLLL